MEIEKLEAGRSLDAMVAERVMNWQWVGFSELRTPIMLPADELARYMPEYLVRHALPGYAGNPPDRLPHYSTSVAAAWEVVEKLKDGCPVGVGFTAHLSYWPPDPPNEKWLVEFGCNNYRSKGERIVTAEGPTLPLAICRAALLAHSNPQPSTDEQPEDQQAGA